MRLTEARIGIWSSLRVPKGQDHSAQGCEARATLGDRNEFPYPEGVARGPLSAATMGQSSAKVPSNDRRENNALIAAANLRPTRNHDHSFLE